MIRGRNVVHYVTGQYMKKNKKRTVITLVGITFMVLLMTCVFVGKSTAISFLQQVGSRRDGKWHVSMYDVAQEELRQVEALDYVEETAVSADLGTTLLETSANEEKPYLTVKEYTRPCFDWMNIELIQGRLPDSPGEIVLSQSILDDGGKVQVGDTVSAKFFHRTITGTGEEGENTVFPFYQLEVKAGETVDVPQNFPYFGENDSFRENREYTGESREYVVTGIMAAPAFEDVSGGSYMGLTLLEDSEIGALSSFNLSIMLNLDRAPDQYAEQLREIADGKEISFNQYVLVFTGDSTDTTVNLIIRFLMTFFVALIMVVSVVLIYNVFQISYRERSMYLGMLSSVGATGRQKRSSVYYEAFVLLFPALVWGVLLGMGAVWLAMQVLKPFLGQFLGMELFADQVPVSLQVSFKDLAAVVLISGLTVLLSAFLPARKIGKIGPVEAIRGNEGKGGKAHKTNLGRMNRFGAESLLARRMLRGQRKKARAIVLAAVSFLVVLTVTSFGAESIRRLVTVRIGESYDMEPNLDRWNYSLSRMGDQGSTVYEAARQELEKSGSASNMVEWRGGSLAADIPGEEMSREYWEETLKIYEQYYGWEMTPEERQDLITRSCPVGILAVDDETMKQMAQIVGADEALLTSGEIPAALVVQQGELSTENISVWGKSSSRYYYSQLKRMTDKQVGEQLHVNLYSPEDGESQMAVTVAGFVTGDELEEYVTFRGQFLWIIVGEKTADQMEERFGSDAPARLSPMTLFHWDSQDTELLERLGRMCDETEDTMIGSLAYARDFAASIIAVIRILAAGFVALASVICLLNLFHSIRGRMEERRGNFAVLRSIGMTGRQIRRMLRIENLRILGRSLVLGLLITAPLLGLMWLGLTLIFGRIALEIPWEMMFLAVAAAAASVMLLSEYCFSRLKEENLLDNIRRSM